MILVDRSSFTPNGIVEDVLSHRHSLAWQKKWTSGIRAGLADADAEEFVSEEEIDAVLNKHAKA